MVGAPAISDLAIVLLVNRQTFHASPSNIRWARPYTNCSPTDETQIHSSRGVT